MCSMDRDRTGRSERGVLQCLIQVKERKGIWRVASGRAQVLAVQDLTCETFRNPPALPERCPGQVVIPFSRFPSRLVSHVA
jgi:hypothetical protein